MKRSKPGKSKLAGKGFYIALAISLVAVGAATTIAISNTLGELSGDSLELPESSANDWGYSDVADDVDTEQSDVPKSSSESSSKSASSRDSSVTSRSDSSTAKSAKTATYAMPVRGEIINAYSNGELVKSKTLGDWRTHDGIDIRVNKNTPVKACADGTVKEVTSNSLWGTTIVIEHSDGYTSYYYGLDETVQVKKDQTMAIGDVIGSVGDTNEMEVAEESHLHFAMKKDGEWIDPQSVIKNG